MAADTRRRILDTARALFNRDGAHRVGVRDVARELGISPGNLAYHFPTKDALVSALVMELHELDARTAFAPLPDELSLADVYRAAVVVMRNMLAYRFVLVGYVDAVLASPELVRLEAVLQARRRARSEALVAGLAAAGHLDARRFARRAAWVHEQAGLVSSGWLVAAELKGPRGDAGVLHYAKVGLQLLEPYCTPRGARQLRRILAGELDGAL